MQFLLRFDVHQPEDMSNLEFVAMWDGEADAALGATVETEVLPIYDYSTFAADMKEELKG
jgi:hypothetical protein